MSDLLFTMLLALFPRDFRERFGPDMRELFRDQLGAARTRGNLAALRLWLRTIPRTIGAALVERATSAPTNTHHAARSDSMWTTLGTDVRYAARVLRKSPVFTLVAVLCISLGSGAVTTIFSALNALVLRPLPGAMQADRLVRIERVRPDGKDGRLGNPYPFYEYLRDRSHMLSGVIAWGKAPLTLAAGGEGASVYGTLVSTNYFAVLGVRPALGRFFTAEEGATPLAHPVIVVAESYWRTRLGADSGAIGRTIAVNGNAYTLVGVAPAAFPGLDAPIHTDAWVPLAMLGQLRRAHNLTDAADGWLQLGGRLRDGSDADGARRELAALTAARASDATAGEPEYFGKFSTVQLSRLTGLPPDASGPLTGFLALLLGAAGLVLLIASVNVASMLSARAIARRREMAVRAALGAGRGRLVRQLLTEILLLFTMGAVGGVALAIVATRALERLPIPGSAGIVSITLDLAPDYRVLGFALLLSLLTGVVFGLAPARQGVRRDITTRLRGDTAGSGTRRGLASDALIVGQLALSLVLLVAAGLFLRALDRGSRVAPGFDATGVAVSAFNTETFGYDSTKARAFYVALRGAVAGLPGVTAVSYAERLPLTMHSSGDDITVDARGGEDAKVSVQLANVDANYFDALRIPILRGRSLGTMDGAQAPPAAVVNETLARRLWPDGSAVGRTFGYGGTRVTIVGIAHDAKYADLAEKTPPFVYFPLAQQWRASQTLIVRTDGSAEQLAPAIRRVVQSIDPGLPRPTVTTLRQENTIVLLPQRVAALVTGSLGGVGVLLAAVGLYGIIAYSVQRRTREIGVRIALGARRSDVLGLIVGDGMRLVGVGVAIGVVLAAGAARLLASFLFDVSPLDAMTYVATAAFLTAVALVASWIPARRAASGDPKVVLRAE